MKHAFLITAYTDEVQLSNLIDELGKKNAEVYIHIDKRSAELTKTITQKYHLAPLFDTY